MKLDWTKMSVAAKQLTLLPTYRVCTYDEEVEWLPRYTGLSKWQLRAVLRHLRWEGWDSVTTLVERENAPKHYFGRNRTVGL